MDKESLINTLRACLEHSLKISGHGALIDENQLVIPPDILDPLEALIRSEPELKEFEGPLWILRPYGRTATFRNLAAWLVVRTYRVWIQQRSSHVDSASIAIGDLVRFVETDEISVSSVAPMIGAAVGKSWDLAPGLRIRPLAGMAIPAFRQNVREGLPMFGPYPQAALEQTAMLRRDDVRSPDSQFKNANEDFVRLSDEFEEVCRILSIAQECTPFLVSLWRQAEEWVPCGELISSGSLLLGRNPHPRENSVFEQEQIEAARSLLIEYSQFQPRDRDTIRLATDRLRLSRAKHLITDSAIDLRVGLEVLFFHGTGEDEKSFTLRVRASRFLSSDPIKRKEISRLLADVYAVGSEAVHTGRVQRDKKRHGKDPIAILSLGRELMASALRMVIEAGKIPDWDEIVYN